MNQDILQKRIEDRFQILKKLFDITEGRASMHSLDIREVGKELGMDENRTFSAFEYLIGENLAVWMALGGFGTITHRGVKEVEQALRGKETPHFPAGIVVVSGTNVQVIQGQGNTTNMQITQQDNGATAKLEELLKKIESPLPAGANKLVELSSAAETQRFEIAEITSKLADSDPKWITPLVDFAKTTLSELGAKFLAEAILFGLKGR